MPEKNKIHPNVKARVMPQNQEAEQAVLGCCLIDENAPLEVLSRLKSEDFYLDAHKKIFEAMNDLAVRNKPIDLVTLVQELERTGDMESVGGINYLSSLSSVVPSAANVVYYAEIVKENSMRRRLISSAARITDKAFAGGDDGESLTFAEKEIFALGEDTMRSTLNKISEPLKDAVEKMEKLERDPSSQRGIPTGFFGLDMLLNGFQEGDLIIIAARPGQGKTSIGMNFIQAAAMAKKKTSSGAEVGIKAAVFSLEMPAVQIANRLVCSVGKVSMSKAKSGKLDGADWKRIMRAKKQIDEMDIFVDDTSATSPMEIISKCRRLKREKGLDIIMIDYLQLMSSGKRVENRQQEISEITRMLKIAAKELSVPILLLSQLSREVEKRSNKTPVMSDLRESGAIEQDADIIMFLYRKYESTDTSVDEETRNKVELIVAKHRNGDLGKVMLRWRGSYTSFEDYDERKSGDGAPPEVEAERILSVPPVSEDLPL